MPTTHSAKIVMRKTEDGGLLTEMGLPTRSLLLETDNGKPPIRVGVSIGGARALSPGSTFQVEVASIYPEGDHLLGPRARFSVWYGRIVGVCTIDG